MVAGVVQRCDCKIGQIIDGRYEIERTLGEGAFGKVFCVKDGTGAVYALKILKLWEVDPSIRKILNARFELEFQTARIDSPYLVHSYQYGQIEGNPYIIMEYCPNGDLTQYILNSKADMVNIAAEVLFGLKDLHRFGKVHRDLKPENVLFKKDGRAALTDFGICGDRNKRLTERSILGRPQEMFGTYAYMPPEQVNRARGNATVLPTTDIFSFGVMMYQVLTGVLPFGPINNYNDLAVYQLNAKNGTWNINALKRRVPFNSFWVKMITGCLKSDYQQRLSSADEVLSYFPNSLINSRKAAPMIDAPLMGSMGKGLCLRVTQGDNPGTYYYLRQLLKNNQYILTVGRDESNQIVLPEKDTTYISRFHCTIEANEDYTQWFIRDGQWREGAWKTSLNGTYIDSKKVTGEGMKIRVGDIISVGDMKMRVEN